MPDGRRFDRDVLGKIIGLLSLSPFLAEKIHSALDSVLTDIWKANDWSDLMVFTSADMTAALTPGDKLPEELTAPVIVKKLGYIVDYARVGTLTPQTSMSDIVKSVNKAAARANTTLLQPTSPSRQSAPVFDKKAVPTLDKFSGQDEDYFTWKEATINALGTAGFGRFLDDTTMTEKHPDVSESVFYSLRGAVHGGQAQSIAQRMLDEKLLDPAKLWSDLESYYNTALNRANVVLFDIRRLLNLRLDPDTTATKFISDYRDCLQRLRKNNARLSEDTDTLRALLLVSIQDDDFEMVRDTIVHRPQSSVEMILTEIRERETSLMMKDRASNLSGDGSHPSRQSRRVSSTTKRGVTSTSSAGYNDNRKWVIPKYPDTWKKAFGGPLFKLMLDWRTEAHKGKNQLQLNSEFDTVVERICPPNNSNKNTSSRKDGGASVPTVSSASTQSGDSTAGETPDPASTTPARKRIRLQKSRRVVTERSS